MDLQRARIDDLFYAIAHAVKARLTYDEKSHRDLLDELSERLVDKYFAGTTSSVEGIGIFEVAEESWRMHRQAFGHDPLLAFVRKPGTGARWLDTVHVTSLAPAL
mgnify:CR=1 FL=1